MWTLNYLTRCGLAVERRFHGSDAAWREYHRTQMHTNVAFAELRNPEHKTVAEFRRG